MNKADLAKILKSYDPSQLTIGTLGGHSALDVCRGAKKYGFQTLVVAQKGREKTYTKYFKTRSEIGCVDHIILVDHFRDIMKPAVQKELRQLNTLFVQSRYFWVYCDFAKNENKFAVPILGSRNMLKLEERDQQKNQYYLLKKAGIRIPKLFATPKEIDRHVLVKVNEAARGYERAFFVAANQEQYYEKAGQLIAEERITRPDLEKAVIEEFVLGAHVNFNFYYSPIEKRLELMGTDTRRQTNLDGLLRMPAFQQMELGDFRPKMIETGHYTVTVKESLLEKIFDIGERFVRVSQRECAPGIVGPFALQGAVIAEDGKEDIVIFDVSMRIPGSPGTRFTPYTGYLYGESMSVGERLARDVRLAHEGGRLHLLLS